MAEQQDYITIDGVDYKKADLSEECRRQIINLSVTDQEINRLNQLVAIAQTARSVYAKALAEALPKPKAKAAKKKKS